MFSVECPIHGRRVLLWPDRIREIRNTPFGIELHYRCTCGHAGVVSTGRDRGLAA